MSVTPKQLTRLLAATIPAGMPVLITGAPGIGKSDIVSQAADAAGAQLLISHPVVSDPTDAKGLPYPSKDGESATFLPFGDLKLAMGATSSLVWFLDDLGQAAPAVQASFMQLLLARRINGHKLPDSVTFVAATNRRTDRAGVSGILEPVKSRFASILELETNLDDWSQWALGHGIQPEVIAFLRFRPELLSAFKPSNDLVNSPCPRTWSAASKLLTLQLSNDLEYSALAGAVGEGAAGELLSFLRIYRDLPNLDGILLDPQNSPIPTSPSGLYAVSSGLAHKANTTNCGRVFEYASRLQKAGHGEFAVLMVRDAIRKTPPILTTKPFIELAAGPLGRLISGN